MRFYRWALTLPLLILCLQVSTAAAAERIYILAGQSNMMGKGKTFSLPAHYRKTPPNVTFYYQGRERELAQFAYFGPEVVFAHEIARAFPNDQHILIKSVATGSTIDRWLPEQALYKGLLRQVDFSLPESDPKRIAAVVWMQGESDARHTEHARQYANRLSRLIQSLRNDLHSPNSLFIVGEINPEDKNFDEVELVQAGQRQVQQKIPNTLLVSTDGLGKMYDNVHYDAEGQIELGRRFAHAYIAQQAKHPLTNP